MSLQIRHCIRFGKRDHCTKGCSRFPVQSAGDMIIEVPFAISKDKENIEFRVWSMGKMRIVVATERPVKIADGLRSKVTDFSQRCTTIASSTCTRNNLKHLIHHGANISPVPRGALVSIAGLNVAARHHEDFQIINEVLVNNVYRIIPLRESIVIDVGMNNWCCVSFLCESKLGKKNIFFRTLSRSRSNAPRNVRSQFRVKRQDCRPQCASPTKNDSPVVHYSAEGTIARSYAA